jgi:hypothetical protein
MLDLSDPQTYWLNVVNIVLGVVTLACVIVVSTSIWREVSARAHQRVPVFARPDEHTFVLPDLGITMADGGEKIDDSNSTESLRAENEKNIFRSNN